MPQATQKSLPVSVCMISGAEASRIGRALESVSGWAAEIIVVLNTEAVDDTESIAKRHGAKVFREHWKGFIGQKNSAAEKATQPWLLNIDADEVVSPGLAREIQEVICAPEVPHSAYEFPRCTFYCSRWIRHGDWYPDHVCRLWRRGHARWVGQEPHARLEGGGIGRLRSDLLHYSNETIARQISKIAPYQEGAVRERVASGRSASFAELAFRPWWRFVRAYVFRLGFLDGWQGFYIAGLTAFSTLTRYALIRESREHSQPAAPACLPSH